MRTKLMETRKAAKLTETSIARKLGQPRAGYAVFEQGGEPPGGTAEEMMEKIREILNNYEENLFDDI